MAAGTRSIIICVDFGMTGSVARWREPTGRKWTTINSLKTPTQIAYDLETPGGPIVAWGNSCNVFPFDQVKQGFKTYLGATAFSKCPTIPGAPSSEEELHSWTRDFLRMFCADVLSSISRSPNLDPAWRDEVTWNFTVPGSWVKFPVVADFKRLAQEVVFSCFENTKNIRIHVDSTEGNASAISLVEHCSASNKGQHSTGNVVISCDIGGATTDVAISTISNAREPEPLPRLNIEPIGIITIEKAFWSHASEVLQGARVHGADDLALEMIRSAHFASVRSQFSKLQEERVKIKLPASCQVTDWLPSGKPDPSLSIIKDRHLFIHKTIFESFFLDFVKGIEEAIDEAIIVLDEKNLSPDVIGICGGGSQTTFPMERLRSRYGDIATFIDYSQFNRLPEMATVRGSSLLWDREELKSFVSKAKFGIKKSDHIAWKDVEAIQAPSSFEELNSWTVTFSCSGHGEFEQHEIVAVPISIPLPRTFEEDPYFQELDVRGVLEGRKEIYSIFEEEVRSCVLY